MQGEMASPDTVFQFLVDKALEEYKFGSVKDVADKFSISTHRSREILDSLIRKERIVIVYENQQMRVYAPREIIEQIVHTTKKPKWIEKYALPNKQQHLTQKEELDKELYEYERFEELLYLKTILLEEPAMFTFRWLGFNVKPLPKGAYADFELMKDSFLGAVEVAGANGACSMEEIRQLIQYQLEELQKDRDVPNLLVLFNHYADKDIKDRGIPFAKNIVEAGRKHGITLATTYQLYEKIRQVKSGKKSKEIVCKEIMDGK
ncbi:MAG: hypothetical protein ABSC91_03970 [Candidatus Bathyarchaeia archaeon]|jgi:hypothetical protein